MEPNNINPMMNTPSPIITEEHKKVGPMIAALLVVLILVIAALYLFSSRISETQPPVDNYVAPRNEINNNSEGEVPVVTNTSEDPAAIQSDLEASLEGLDNLTF